MNISVVIPTCDRNELIVETLESVLRQTVEPFEIIIVNNGKHPVTLPEKFLDRVKAFTIMPYAGVAQARNFGACVATGDYIAFLDDDDLWSEKYLENVTHVLESGAQIVVSRLDKLEDGKVLPFKNAHEKISLEKILVYNPGITGSNIVVSKKTFFSLQGFDPKLPPSEDKSLLLEALRKQERIVTLPDNEAIIRIHQAARLTDAKKMAEGIFQFVKKYGDIMTRTQKIQNLLKIHRYRYESGRKFSFAPFAIFYFIVRGLKVVKRI